ncbi:hypothetical protein HMI54_001868 [Coelomomyces lativittatus]|nr:hypothetical protein HMI54_001868 [Coelomomyces lativittatus]
MKYFNFYFCVLLIATCISLSLELATDTMLKGNEEMRLELKKLCLKDSRINKILERRNKSYPGKVNLNAEKAFEEEDDEKAFSPILNVESPPEVKVEPPPEVKVEPPPEVKVEPPPKKGNVMPQDNTDPKIVSGKGMPFDSNHSQDNAGTGINKDVDNDDEVYEFIEGDGAEAGETDDYGRNMLDSSQGEQDLDI